MGIVVNKEIDRLEGMPRYLKQRIFGQDHIIDSVVDMLMVNMAGLGDDNKPIASFLFTGATGVGKTELAMEIASYLGIHFERFDMSEYADDSAYRNLIGGHKGLVGYEEGGLLTNAIAEHPHSVLLLDEIEKADKAIYNTFLQVLDYATLKDTKGNSVDFSKTIIVMTSNLGSNEKRGIGFGGNQNLYKEAAVKDFLTPEFRNRIDKILHFNTLTEEMISPIVEKFLTELTLKLSIKNITLNISNAAKDALVSMGFNSAMGARSVKRTITSEFKKELAKEILFGRLKHGGVATIDMAEESFVYDYESPESTVVQPAGMGKPYFQTAEEAQYYAKQNPGTVIVRAISGEGYMVK